MGNGFGKLSVCFTGGGGYGGGEEARRRKEISMLLSDPLDEGLGHSFCYVRPDPTRLSSSKVHSEESTTTFRTISGASVSANTYTPLSTALVDPYVSYSNGCFDRAAAFESTTSFSSIPLQPIPKSLINSSGPMSGSLVPGSGPLERGFMSGPIERGFMSGPLDNVNNNYSRGLFSGPLEKGFSDQFQRSFSHGAFAFKPRSRKGSLIRILQRAISKTVSRGQNSIVAPIKGVVSIKEPEWIIGSEKNPIPHHNENLTVSSLNLSSEGSLDDEESMESQNLQWAQGKAGEIDDIEVQRIIDEHPDDAYALMNDRVKGSLKVTRAFGAGFLKQPKWNDALLEMFRIDYKGTSPYITCVPSLHHHKLGPKDRFLILSSDGLYQYLTNEEAVFEVEHFITLQPEGDPAQHLVEEVLFRAAKKAGMDFHELLEIPQGDRRRYHDDVSIIVISLEGRIWRSCV
ncbi:hypothetical protein GOBAR_AA23493 [Gossypium barbadense]|uniref:PPM-type phosphatase domain-containing protein n=1 Tax=Gossypium barbadense TaxID=3634 RepID=A0A2P5X1G1_GOSBA|nr:hypothetical protein GOBAR_AA23493 [Gossypium barbadense]